MRNLTVVIKLGTSSIVHEKTHEPRISTLGLVVELAVKLRRDGHKVVLVSSGAIGMALQMMDMEKRPKSLPQVQALAAVGQGRLMSMWYRFFMDLRQPAAQILLTRNDIADRTQYLNAQNTLNELLTMGIIPIVNENDTLSVAEIQFGDNDTLSAITSAMLSADYLFLMTDVDCLYTSNPRRDPTAKPIEVVRDIAALEADVSSAGSALGTGGMSTKIVAAKLATSAGVTTVISRSNKPSNVADIIAYCEALKGAETESETSALGAAPLHTRFLPSPVPIRDRSFWLLHGLTPRGTIYIDEGAYRALRNKAGLLPVGVVAVEGHFSQQEAVRLVVVKRPTDNTTPPTSQGAEVKPNPPSGAQHSDAMHSDSEVATATAGLAVYESLSSLDAHPPPTPYATSGGISGVQTPATTPSTSAQQTLPIVETLAALITPASDSFEQSNPPPKEVGRALVNYAATEIARIKGMQSREIPGVLGYADTDYVAFRENVGLSDITVATSSATTTPERQPGKKFGNLGSFA